MNISEIINSINVALNYPSATIDDLKLFMEQAISEINSELHISIPSILDMEKEIEDENSNKNNLVLLSSKPDSSTIIPTYTGSEDMSSYSYYYDFTNNKYAIKKESDTEYFDSLYGIYNDYNSPPTIYQAVVLSEDIVMWFIPNEKNVRDFNLENYLTKDWIYLYFIPYVCFKYSVRDGDTGALFSEEFTQGFQQLRNAYNIPSKVLLKAVCHKPAYTKLAEENIDNLNIIVSTRAITEDMKISNTMKAFWGDDFYTKGGWGL